MTKTTALIRLLRKTIDADHFPLLPRVQTWQVILASLRPEPARPSPLPPLKVYEPPSKGRYRRRG
jgi:hypothetical protein